MVRRGSLGELFALVCGVILQSGCSQATAGAEPVLVEPPANGACTDLARAIAKWEGRELSVCGPEALRFRSLTPLGDGLIFGWTPGTGNSELWGLAADNTLGTGPLAANYSPANLNNLLLVVMGDRVIAYNQKSGQVDVNQVDLTVRGVGDIWRTTVSTQTWFRPGGGRDLVALDATNILDWQPSTGTYGVVGFRRDDDTFPFDRSASLGTREEFRRGHRLVALGAQRLLEWVPHSHDYRIWHYALERMPSDIFDAAPASSGTWPELGQLDEILLLASDRLGIWHRETGTLETRAFDPMAADPLAGPLLATSQDDRLRSLPPAWEKQTTSRIRRLVLVFQQGRSFDSYFGQYCQALPGSEPSCEEGAPCCEGMPTAIAGADHCRPLNPDDDTYVPNGSSLCLWEKMDGGAMDRFATSNFAGCGDPRDFACDPPGNPADPIGVYHDLAKQGAVADRYFASIANSAELNLLYFGLTGFLPQLTGESAPAIGAITAYAQIPWALYLSDALNTQGQEIPYYYDGHWAHYRYLAELAYDISTEQLAPISLVVPGSEADEAPGQPSSLSDGTALVASIAKQIAESPRYAAETLVLIVHLTSGGFYDHVSPPPTPPGDIDPAQIPYGPRVPFLALGPFVRQGHVSHTPLEHSSITRFIEWNWFDGKTGQLGFRDQFVNNLGSLFDPAATGTTVP